MVLQKMNKKLITFLSLIVVSSSTITGCSNDSILTTSQTEITSPANLTTKSDESAMMGMFSNVAKASSSELYPTDASAGDIQQALRPVCYFLSALAGLAQHRPEEVKKLVVDNGDNTYTVTFPGLPKGKNIITVKKDEVTDIGVYINKGKNGSLWAPVAIKAVAKYWADHGLLRFLKSKSDAGDWGGAWEGIEIVTGHVADFMLVNLNTTDRILSKMDAAFKAKKLVSVSTFGKGNKHPKKVGELKFSSAHVLTAISVDVANKTITIRDPYGKYKKLAADGAIIEDKTTDGVVTLPMADFKKYFADIAIETNKKSNFLSRLRYLK